MIWLCIWLLAGCSFSAPLAPPTAVQRPPQDDAAPVGVWHSLASGLETLQTSDGLSAIRHAPTAVRYDSRFRPNPDEALPVSAWLSEDAAALVAVNCGFFSENAGDYAHIGLLMTNGQEWAALRSRWGAVLIVRDAAAFIVRRPERLLAPATLGIQGWPMLLQDGGLIPRLDASDLARRTAVGLDASGHIVWVVAPGGFTLADFAQRLQQPDLALIDAVNLDGGGSTGLRWRPTPDAAQSGPDSLPIPCALLLSTL